jgi:hypothetical protein
VAIPGTDRCPDHAPASIDPYEIDLEFRAEVDWWCRRFDAMTDMKSALMECGVDAEVLLAAWRSTGWGRS